jgi:hypothetical protein
MRKSVNYSRVVVAGAVSLILAIEAFPGGGMPE